MKAPDVVVDAATGRAIAAGATGVPRSALRGRTPAMEPGTIVQVSAQGFVARGLWEPDGPVAVRVLTRDAGESVDGAFWARRIRSAVHLRRSLLDLSATDAFRVVNGGGDGLPGLSLESFSGFAVLSAEGAAWRPHMAAVYDAIRAEIAPRGVYEKRPGPDGGLSVHLGGTSAPDNLSVREGDCRLLARLSRGGTTGVPLDMRLLRGAVARHARGRAVLACHSGAGTLGVAAARGGSPRVFSIDADEVAVAWSREAIAANGIPSESHEFSVGEPLEVLRSLERSTRRFDLALIEAPTFSFRRLLATPPAPPAPPAPPEAAAPARSKGSGSKPGRATKRPSRARAAKKPARAARAVPPAPPAGPPDPARGYRDLLRALLPVLKPQALVAFATSEGARPEEDVLATFRNAALDEGTRFQVLESHGPPPDFPATPACPEARDWRFVICALRA